MVMTIANTAHLWLEITEAQLQESWDYSQALTNSLNRRQVYLNHLCLAIFLPWLETEATEHSFNSPQVFPSIATLPTIWSVVNGTAIEINHKRLVLIPEEHFDTEELRVPQEWIDIPGWIADYYLAVQIDTEEGWLRVWGYTTHQQLKTRGSYVSRDRSYSLAEIDLKDDLTVLLISEELFPERITRSEISPLPSLSLIEANNLIQRLGNPGVIFPRRTVPFSTWGALLEHGGWRQNLYRMREGLSAFPSVKQWLQTGIDEFTQRFGWRNSQLQAGLARDIQEAAPLTYLSRQLTIAGQVYELRIIPEDMEANVWRFELQSLQVGGLIPGGFKLRLLTEELEEFEDNEDIATTAVGQLVVVVELESGEGLVWETEPLPDNYDREILRF
ncbi:MAG: DUF1822 family protein [Xenococcaceae cyanobacterium MO_167.B27]|nr:DUF1822 family protein [Xenococcaceae cyanobacterium MO_167.B27]